MNIYSAWEHLINLYPPKKYSITEQDQNQGTKEAVCDLHLVHTGETWEMDLLNI